MRTATPANTSPVNDSDMSDYAEEISQRLEDRLIEGDVNGINGQMQARSFRKKHA